MPWLCTRSTDLSRMPAMPSWELRVCGSACPSWILLHSERPLASLAALLELEVAAVFSVPVPPCAIQSLTLGAAGLCPNFAVNA